MRIYIFILYNFFTYLKLIFLNYKTAYVDLEIYGRQLYNDSSLGLYHMSEHIRKRVPQIVEEKVTSFLLFL